MKGGRTHTSFFLDLFCSRSSTKVPWWQMRLRVHLLASRSCRNKGPAWMPPSLPFSAWESSTPTLLVLEGEMTKWHILVVSWIRSQSQSLLCVLFFSGGVMLVHSIRKNETRVIDFRETAPSSIHEDLLTLNLDQKVRNFIGWHYKKMGLFVCCVQRALLGFQPGLLVGVPGMLSGMHQAHQLYGRYRYDWL